MNISNLFQNNRDWAAAECEQDPEFFSRLATQQKPDYLWIGCSDSRVPANEIIGLRPGNVFVHRNVANLVVHSDLNCLSVVQFAVDVLGVSHIIVCGHYGCGGVGAAMSNEHHGLIDNWLLHIKALYRQHQSSLALLEREADRVDRLCELNVIAQAINVGSSTVVRDAWLRGQQLTVHALIYSIADGLLRDLNASMSSLEDHRKYATGKILPASLLPGAT